MPGTEPQITAQGTFVDIRARLLELYGAANLLCILAYGTMVTNPEMTDLYSDYDVTVVFKDYPTDPLPNLPPKTNLTVLFWPEIQLGGVTFFRLYNHGSFYIHVLAGATALHGTNPFKAMIPLLNQRQLHRSLADQVLMHCSKLATLSMGTPSRRRCREIIKYSFRIVQNLYFLRTSRIDYVPFHHCTFSDWINLFESSQVIPSFATGFLRERLCQDDFPTPDMVLRFIHRIKSMVTQTCS